MERRFYCGHSVVFLPLTIAATGPSATDLTAVADSRNRAYEVIGPQVFRFEYYLLKGQEEVARCNPISLIRMGHGFQDTQTSAACVMLQRSSRTSRSLTKEQSPSNRCADCDVGRYIRLTTADPPLLIVRHRIGKPQGSCDDSGNARSTVQFGLPRATISGIRVYERYFILISEASNARFSFAQAIL